MAKNGGGRALVVMPESAEGSAAWALLKTLLVMLASDERNPMEHRTIVNLVGIAREKLAAERPDETAAARLLRDLEEMWEQRAALLAAKPPPKRD